MTKRKLFLRSILVSIATVSLLSPSTAHAHDLIASISGAEARSLHPHTQISVKDTACDSREVKAMWKTNSGSVSEQHNGSGCGRTLTFDQGNVVGLKACVVIDFWPDNCSNPAGLW